MILKLKFYIFEKIEKLIIFQKLLFSASTKRLKTIFFENLSILKNLSKHIKINFFDKKVIFCQKNLKQTHLYAM